MRPQLSEVRPGIEPGPLPYHGSVQPMHLQTLCRSLTLAACCSVIPDGIEPSFPGCHPGVFASGPRDQSVQPAGVEPARTRVSDGGLNRSASAGWQRPVRELNPSHLLDGQAGTPASSQGLESVRRESHPPVYLGKVVPGLLGHGHISKDGRIRTLSVSFGGTLLSQEHVPIQ